VAPATLVILLAATLLAAGGDAKERARQMVRQAHVAYDLGNYDEAASFYEAAYRLVQDPALLYNIGQAFRLAGRTEKALAAYKGFLRTAPADDPNRAAVVGRVADLERALRSPPSEARPPPVEPPPPPPPPPASGPAPAEGTVYEPAAPQESAPGFRTSAGAHLGFGGRAHKDENAVNFRAFGRLADPGGRSYELGYVRRPIYPMNPVYQYSAVYGVFRSPQHWMAEAGALGSEGEWHLGGGYTSDNFDAGLRVERASPDHLCNSSAATLLYLVPEARLRVPVSSSFRVLGAGSYRGKLSAHDCNFHPSMVTLQLGGELDLSLVWTVSGGLGHYGLFDFGPGQPDGPWPSRSSAAEELRLAGRYLIGKVVLFAEYRFITYSGGTHELVLGAEFRSGPDAP
jgi:tetratricopeptide (TPR) repeat protein